MKKFLLAILSALLIICAGAAFACSPTSPDGTYYTLVFKQTNGVTYVCDIPSGYEVLEGTTVTFSLRLSDDAEGDPVVYANDDILEEQGGKYSFTMSKNTVVRVDGLMAQGSEYNKIVFAYTAGVTYNILTEDGNGHKLGSGMLVKMGTEVSFSIVTSENYSGEATVYANGEPLTPQNGVYTFTMNAPTTISVGGIVQNVSVTYVSADTRVKYTDERGNYISADTAISAVAGDVLKFKVKISVYHVQEGYDVLANGTVLSPDSEGFYTYALTDDAQISVSGLQQDASFLERSDGGRGTFNSPFLIKRPIDLYQMAMQINSGMNTDGMFYAGYYRLENDIDLEGEQLYVIGDSNQDANGYAIFSGNFNGNGHTISNYVMNDDWINQDSFVQMYLTSVGLFGVAMATERSSPLIYNLHIDNAKITVDASRYNSAEGHVGVLIGSSYGAAVNGCTVTNSTIEVTGGENYGTCVGGLIGQQLSAYSTSGNINYFSGVTSCSTDVDIYVNDNFVYAVGGISGLLAVGEEHLTSYILNCYSAGDIEGGLNAGGIVGYTAPGTSVLNCYSSGNVIAGSSFDIAGVGYAEQLAYANAGGIVGRAGFNTVIYNSFSTGYTDAIAVSGSNYQVTDPVAAKVENGSDLQDAHSYPATIFGSKGATPAQVTETFIRNEMHWDEEDWTFADGMPALNFNSSSKQFTITFHADQEFGPVPQPFQIISQYFSMSRWIMLGSIREYVQGNGNNRSYGYFFDSGLQNRIPLAFVPTGDMDIYIGYSDYGEVAGVYYLGTSADTGARLELDGEGNATYVNGALSQDAVYTYDGETIVILGSALGDLSDALDDLPDPAERYREYYLSSLYNFGATVNDGRIEITGGYVQEVSIQNVPSTDLYGDTVMVEQIAVTGGSFNLFDAPLTGLKSIENFKYIDYYDGTTVYTFNGNGTGVRTNDGVTSYFTYTYNGDGLTVYFGNGSPVVATLSDGYVTKIGDNAVQPFDGFTGVWEGPFAENVTYTFNGKSKVGEGSWTKKGVDGEASGTYTVDDSGVLTADGFTAKIEDGLLVITVNGVDKTLYKGGSFVGEWYYSQRPQAGGSAVTINLMLNGITDSGLGVAEAVYVATGETVRLTYRALEKDGSYTLSVYNQATEFANLTYDVAVHTLSGTLGGAPARLTSYDGIKGLWISDDADVKEVQFNGRGFYSLTGDSALGALAINGTVSVNGTGSGKYTLDYDTMSGSFTYKNVEYTIKYDISADSISVTAEGKSFNLHHRDAWYNRKLVDDNGLVYTFDGRGELENGGAVVATDGNTEGGTAHYREYTYKIEGDVLILESREASAYKGGKITIGDKDGKRVFLFETSDGTSTALTYSTPFTGEWIVGGEIGELTIGKVYADGTAEGSCHFSGEDQAAVAFTYYEDGNYLSFSYGEVTYYVNALTSETTTELSVGIENSIYGSGNSICIKAELADEYRGTTYNLYNAETKTNSGETMIFDGLSASEFGSGTAMVRNAQGMMTAAHSYTVDQHGNICVISGNSTYVMIEWVKDSELNYSVLYYIHGNDKYYAIVYPDSLYGLTVRDVDNGSVTYTFNGAGDVVRHDAYGADTAYKYFVLLADNATYMHIVRFTDSQGNIYSVTLDQSSTSADDWTVKMSRADEYFAVEAQEANSQTASYLFDGAGRVIRLTTDADEAAVNYSYVLESKEGGISTFTFTNSLTGTQYTAVLDQSSQNREEWTVTLTAKN